MAFDQPRESAARAPDEHVEAPHATPADDASFLQQSLSELGVAPTKRKQSGASARSQSLGEMGEVVQRRAKGAHDGDRADAAREGVAGANQRLPHGDKIQAAFGKHDVSGVRARVGGDAADAAEDIDAEAYAVGDRVGFAKEPDLHTAAHEAAHVAQQRAGKVSGHGVGATDDAHEREADQIADAVVAGESAEPLLDQAAGNLTAAPAGGVNTGMVQRKQSQKSAFEPSLVRWAGKQTHRSLGEVYEHEVRVMNADSAPKGTKYDWSHEVRGPSYRPTNKPDKPVLQGPSTYYPFQVRGVGTYGVLTKVDYGVGKNRHEEHTETLVIVDRITKHRTEIETEKDGKKRPFAGSMLVGEDLVITTTMNDVVHHRSDPVESARAHVAIPGLDFKGIKALTHGVYEIRLHASHVGAAFGQVAALPYDTKYGDTPVHVISADIRKSDKQDDNPDARPADFNAAKSWLKSDYDHQFRMMEKGADALGKQAEKTDPPRKQSKWVDILLGCATAALGGAAAGMSLAVAKHLIKNGVADGIQEGVKSFMEQGLVAAATAQFSKEKAQDDFPHVAFYKFMSSAISTKQRDFEQHEFANVVVPKLDAQERTRPGSGFAEALALDHSLKAEAGNVLEEQFQKSFEQWIKFVTKAQLGEVGKKDPNDPTSETGTDMSKQQERDGRGNLPDTAGVIHINISFMGTYDPRNPVVFERAKMPGMNQKLRSRIAQYTIRDLPFAVRVHGSAPGRYNGSYTFSRNEQGMYWLSKHDHEYLARKGGGLAEDGARKILEREIGDVQMTPEG